MSAMADVVINTRCKVSKGRNKQKAARKGTSNTSHMVIDEKMHQAVSPLLLVFQLTIQKFRAGAASVKSVVK